MQGDSGILDHILGSEARVRVVRFMIADSLRPSSISEIVDGTGLTKQGVANALRQLVAQGVVIRSGSGRSNLYVFRDDSPLKVPLRALFDVEATVRQELVDDLRNALTRVPHLRAAWVRNWPEAMGEPIEIEAVLDGAQLAEARTECRAAILPVETRHDRVIEVTLYTPGERPDVGWSDVTILAGAPDAGASRTLPDGLTRDERARRTMRSVASLFTRDPSLRPRARRHLDRLLTQDQGAAVHDLIEWRQILDAYSDQRLVDFLETAGPRAMRLYQSMPFLAVLSARDIDELYVAMGEPE